MTPPNGAGTPRTINLKHQSVLHSWSQSADGRRQTFTADASSSVPKIQLDTALWEDMGTPGHVVVSVEPGDHIAQPELDPLDEQERQSLTVWGEGFSAQVQYHNPLLDMETFETGPAVPTLVLHLHDDVARQGPDAVLSERDMAKLRAILNEAARRA